MADKKKLKALKDRLNKGDDLYLSAKDIPEDGLLVRVIDAIHPNMNGVFQFTEICFWLDKKVKILSNATFGKPCVIEEEIADALANDKTGKIAAKLADEDAFQRSEVQKFNVAQLDDDLNVVGDKLKIFQASQKTINNPLLALALNPDYCRKSEDGIFDPKYGRNVRIIKTTGKGGSTRYDVQPYPESTKMSKKWYDPKNVPDIVNITKADLKSDAEQRELIKEWLYAGTGLSAGKSELSLDKTEKKKKKKKKKNK